jgi:putative MATE family efflux protein
MQNFGKDMTVGSVPKHLLSFSIPMLIGNALQTAYNIVDTFWVGQTVGADAVGASAVSFPIIFMLIALASGATIATTILVAQYYGAKNYTMVERVVNNSFTISLILGAVMTIIGLTSSGLILRLMNTPEAIFDMALGYLRITVAGYILMYLGFLITSILRGIGDTSTPLIFMTIGTVINAVLDPLLIVGVGPFPRLGLNGAAWASLIGQAIASALALIYLNHKGHIVAFNPKKLIFDRQLTLLIFKLGFPSMIQQSLVSIGNAFITSFVNSFGPAAIAAFGAATKIDNVAFMPAMSLGMAASALAGQNLGAKKPERVREVFKWGVVMTSIITVVISIAAVTFPRSLMTIFVQEQEVIEMGTTYLRIVGAGYILFAIMFISNGIINGAGHTMVTMLFTLVSLWLIRVPASALLSRTELGLKGIWIAAITSFFITMSISLVYYFSGRWKKVVIKHGPKDTGAPASDDAASSTATLHEPEVPEI